jgi:hypothetical protein
MGRRRGEISRREGERELSQEREAMEKPKERATLEKKLFRRRAREAREKPLDRGEPLLERGSPRGRETRSEELMGCHGERSEGAKEKRGSRPPLERSAKEAEP